MRLRLVAIKYGCDFRSSELTLYEELRKEKRYKQIGELSSGQVILFVSRTENQLIWLFPTPLMKNARGEAVSVIDSRRNRLLHGTWNPQLLGNYAQAVGIELIGIRLFEDAYKQDREMRHAHKHEGADYESHSHYSLHMATAKAS